MARSKHYSMHIQNAVTELQQYMDTHPIKHKTLDTIWEKHQGNSRSMIEKAFKDITGYRIKEYLVLVRLEYSKRYLLQGNGIKKATAKSMYKSQSAYCTAFKRHFNQTPRHWIKTAQQ